MAKESFEAFQGCLVGQGFASSLLTLAYLRPILDARTRIDTPSIRTKHAHANPAKRALIHYAGWAWVVEVIFWRIGGVVGFGLGWKMVEQARLPIVCFRLMKVLVLHEKMLQMSPRNSQKYSW